MVFNKLQVSDQNTQQFVRRDNYMLNEGCLILEKFKVMTAEMSTDKIQSWSKWLLETVMRMILFDLSTTLLRLDR